MGQTIAASLLLLIKQSQLVIAIWDSNTLESSNVAFELGIAFGANIPILLLVNNPHELPANLTSFPLVIADHDDEEALEFAITQVINHSQKPKGTKNSEVSKAHDAVSDVVMEARDAIMRGGLRESEAIRLLTKALEARSASVIAEARLEDKNYRALRPDFLVFDPELESLLGGPLLIEVKDGTRNRDAEEAGHQQLKRYLATGVTRWGLLLIYPHAKNSGYFGDSDPEQNILVLGVADFLTQLASTPLSSIIRHMRNQYVHRGVAR